MLCPVCKTTQLVMSERKGVEIDYCPQCRGVWLDRGEIDKIIERSLAEQASNSHVAPAGQYRDDYAPQARQTHHGHQGHQGHHKQHYHKKSIWHEIFD